MAFSPFDRPDSWGAHPSAAALHLQARPGTGVPQPSGALTPALAGTQLDRLSQVVLQLHRGSRDWPAASFATRACELLAGLLPYAACLWGSVRADTPAGTRLDMQGLHAEGLSPEALALCLIGLGSPPALQATQDEPLAARRVELRLWRTGLAPLCNDADRAALHFLMPHLVEAQRENRLGRAHDKDAAAPARRSHVLCDAEGVLQQVDEQGLALLRSEWPRWLGARLPETLASAVAEVARGAGTVSASAVPRPDTGTGIGPATDGSGADPQTVPFHGRQVTVLITRSGDALLLEVRRRGAVDRLSTRQRDIARLYASGQTGPQIATQLGLSPSTVNNHLGVIFKKLSVSNKVQLLNAMRLR